MYTLTARNVHQALPRAVNLLLEVGVRRESRNGPVLQAARPVSTTYERPAERVMFWPARDANPFFHLFESLWMLAGRADVSSLTKIVKRMAAFSDDGETQHGAYGRRWRGWFPAFHGGAKRDQLSIIIERLRKNPDDRRCVLGMWDPSWDLGGDGKDVPCNTTATVQVGVDGRVDLTVFCRSNDVVLGCYGANAVHFSVLHEYLSRALARPQGTYTQVSVNWHGYLATLEPLLREDAAYGCQVSDLGSCEDAYAAGAIPYPIMANDDYASWDVDCASLCRMWGSDDVLMPTAYRDPFFREVAIPVLQAHRAWTLPGRGSALDRGNAALDRLAGCRADDWRIACIDWIMRRVDRAQRAADDGVHAAAEA